MTINFHRNESARAIFAAFRHTIGPKFSLGLTLLALCLGSPTSQAVPPTDKASHSKSFPIRGGSQPFAITMGADGNFWFTLSNSNEVARITPHGKISYFVTPTLSNPAFVTPGPDGNIWIASAFVSQVARVTPAVEITIFQTPSTPTIIRPGNSNNLLFTEFSANKIASITTDGVVTESAEFPQSAPVGITAGVGSGVWFLGTSTNRVYETVAPQ